MGQPGLCVTTLKVSLACDKVQAQRTQAGPVLSLLFPEDTIFSLGAYAATMSQGPFGDKVAIKDNRLPSEN